MSPRELAFLDCVFLPRTPFCGLRPQLISGLHSQALSPFLSFESRLCLPFCPSCPSKHPPTPSPVPPLPRTSVPLPFWHPSSCRVGWGEALSLSLLRAEAGILVTATRSVLFLPPHGPDVWATKILRADSHALTWFK